MTDELFNVCARAGQSGKCIPESNGDQREAIKSGNTITVDVLENLQVTILQNSCLHFSKS